ncbi:MAG TPA: hypothetical protein VEZ14_08275 [Dehalococcoidia bacterium]|nr:hypothetical protein [Dehalococcoidia bacterium]
MIDFNSFQTFSGLLAFSALLAFFYRRLTTAAILLTISGAGGVGIFWERWSKLTGHDARVTALVSGVRPTNAQLWLFATHFPLLVLGVASLVVLARKGDSERNARDA